MTSWRTGYADSSGERIYWECAGDGVPIVICHGVGGNHVSFYQQVVGLSSDRNQVVVWDLRGYGNSTLATGVFGIEEAVADLSAVLEEIGLGETPVHLVGQALGAFVAATWAISNPDRAMTLALWDSPFAVANEGQDLVWALEPDAQIVTAAQTNRQVGHSVAIGAGFVERDPVRTYLYQTIQELGNAKPTYAQVFKAAKDAPVAIAQLVALDIPILLGRGERVHTADEATLQELASLIPRATTTTLAGSGHSPYFETPDQWNDAIRKHIAGEDR